MSFALRLVAVLLLVAGIAGPGGSARADDAEVPRRELEPVPRLVAFPIGAEGGMDDDAEQRIELEIQRTFASLGNIQSGRELLVKRFGVMSVPALNAALQRDNNVSEVWNAALTIAALRDSEGAALELKSSLKPLVTHLSDRGSEIHIRGFAALALGCFPWKEGAVPKRYRKHELSEFAVPGPARKTEQASWTLAEARRFLVLRVSDKVAFNSVAASLALAKMGGPDVRRELFAEPPPDFANSGPARALLLARGFLVPGDPKPFIAALGDDESRIRQAAALGMSVAMLQEKPPEWTLEGERILRDLKNGHRTSESDPEAVFARGVCAHMNQLNEEWRVLWTCALTPSSKRNCAEAAAQMLLFCELPWFKEALVAQAARPGESMKPSVLGLSLLRCGRAGTPAALDVTSRWLKSRARRPATNRRWDPRWYAAIGLLRALHEGRLAGQSERIVAVDLLRYALDRTIDEDAPIHAALERVVEEHADRLVAPKSAALYRLPRAALKEVEQSFRCPHGLLASDPRDACARRVNESVYRIFGLDALTKNKPGEVRQQPQRYLRRYLVRYPYFSRLEFLQERGFRDMPAYDDPSPTVIDR